MARKTIISTAAWEVVAAAPKAMPSTLWSEIKIRAKFQKNPELLLPAACTTKPSVAVNDLLDLEKPLSGSGKRKSNNIRNMLFVSLGWGRNFKTYLTTQYNYCHFLTWNLPLDLDEPIWSINNIKMNPRTNAKPITVSSPWVPWLWPCGTEAIADGVFSWAFSISVK